MTDSEKLDLLLEKVNDIETDIRDIKLTFENEIRVNIKRVAEGHLDLSRNLHEADFFRRFVKLVFNICQKAVSRSENAVSDICCKLLPGG